VPGPGQRAVDAVAAVGAWIGPALEQDAGAQVTRTRDRQRGQDDLGFHLGKHGSQTVARAATKGHKAIWRLSLPLLRRKPVWIKAVWIGPVLWAPMGQVDRVHHTGPGGEGVLLEVYICCGDTGPQMDRGIET
jgi:hypothetical protein